MEMKRARHRRRQTEREREGQTKKEGISIREQQRGRLRDFHLHHSILEAQSTPSLPLSNTNEMI